MDITPYKVDKIKCFLMGDSETGKTSFMATLNTGQFPDAFVPDLYDNISINVDKQKFNQVDESNDDKLNIKFYESDSNEDRSDQFRQILTEIQKEDDASNTRYLILLCFSHDSNSTYKSIEKKWLSELAYLNYNHSLDRKIPFLLLGLKSDTLKNLDQQEHQQNYDTNNIYSSTLKLNSKQEKSVKKVNYKEISKKLGAYDYVEVSSKLNNINKNSFYKLIYETITNSQLNTKEPINSKKYSKFESSGTKNDTVKSKLNTFMMRFSRSLFACTSASHEKSKQFVNSRIRDSFRRTLNRKSHVLLKGNSMISLDELC